MKELSKTSSKLRDAFSEKKIRTKIIQLLDKNPVYDIPSMIDVYIQRPIRVINISSIFKFYPVDASAVVLYIQVYFRLQTPLLHNGWLIEQYLVI